MSISFAPNKLFFSYKQVYAQATRHRLYANGFFKSNDLLFFSFVRNPNLLLAGHLLIIFGPTLKVSYLYNKKFFFSRLIDYYLKHSPKAGKNNPLLYVCRFSKKNISLLRRYRTKRYFGYLIGKNLFSSGFNQRHILQSKRLGFLNKYYLLSRLESWSLLRKLFERLGQQENCKFFTFCLLLLYLHKMKKKHVLLQNFFKN